MGSSRLQDSTHFFKYFVERLSLLFQEKVSVFFEEIKVDTFLVECPVASFSEDPRIALIPGQSLILDLPRW